MADRHGHSPRTTTSQYGQLCRSALALSVSTARDAFGSSSTRRAASLICVSIVKTSARSLPARGRHASKRRRRGRAAHLQDTIRGRRSFAALTRVSRKAAPQVPRFAHDQPATGTGGNVGSSSPAHTPGICGRKCSQHFSVRFSFGKLASLLQFVTDRHEMSHLLRRKSLDQRAIFKRLRFDPGYQFG